MPKKTKKEKIRAAHHRQNIPSSRSDSISDSLERSDNPSEYTFTTIRQKKIDNIRQENVTELQAIKHDLLKTLTLAAVAIAVECALYFAIRK